MTSRLRSVVGSQGPRPAASARQAVGVRAHAKINLSLRVLGRRDDGYHDLRTVFQALSLHDTLTIVGRPGPFALEGDGVPDLPLDERNLVWRAAAELWRHLGRPGQPRDVLVRLTKRIPMKAGLGGGSADAAAAIAGLARVWGIGLDASELATLGRGLGADVGFFFTGGAALGLGRGDEIYPLADLPRLSVLLVVPGFEVSTPEAYRWVDEDRAGESPLAPRAGQAIPGCGWGPPANEVVNDFEPAVAARHPELGEITGALSAAGAAAAALSGSGSSVFGLFADPGQRDLAARRLAQSGYAVVRAHTLSRAAYGRSSAPVETPGPDPALPASLSHPDAVV